MNIKSYFYANEDKMWKQKCQQLHMKGWGRSVVKATGFCFISDDGNQFKGNDFLLSHFKMEMVLFCFDCINVD